MASDLGDEASGVADEDLEAWREARQKLSLQVLKSRVYEDPKSYRLTVKAVKAALINILINIGGILLGVFLWSLSPDSWLHDAFWPAVIVGFGARLIRGLIGFIQYDRVRRGFAVIPNLALEGAKYVLLSISPIAGLYILIGGGISILGLFWWFFLDLIGTPQNLGAAVVYLTFVTSMIVFAYLPHGPFRSILFRAVEKVVPGDRDYHRCERGFLKWGLLHAHRGVLLLAIGVVLIVNLEKVAGSPFVGKRILSSTQWASLRQAINAAMLTFLALDAYVTIYHPAWIKGREADHGG